MNIAGIVDREVSTLLDRLRAAADRFVAADDARDVGESIRAASAIGELLAGPPIYVKGAIVRLLADEARDRRGTVGR